MRRLVQTSVGPVLLDFYGDSVVGVFVFDASGQQVKDGEWGDAEVGRALFYVAGVPEPEADAIEESVLAEWRAAGGNPSGRWEGADDNYGSAISGLILLFFVVFFLLGLIWAIRLSVGLVT